MPQWAEELSTMYYHWNELSWYIPTAAPWTTVVVVHRSAITPFGRNSSKHGVCYYFQGFHMYIWDVRRKINPLLLGFRNVFIKNPESWYHRSCFENGSTTWMFKEHSSCFTDFFSAILELRADYVVYI